MRGQPLGQFHSGWDAHVHRIADTCEIGECSPTERGSLCDDFLSCAAWPDLSGPSGSPMGHLPCRYQAAGLVGSRRDPGALEVRQ